MSKLQLALKAEYFDAIKAGTKRHEYRLVSPYWERRLYADWNGVRTIRNFSGLVLTRGYPKRGDTDRIIELPWRGWTRKTITHPHFGPDPVEVFAITADYPPPAERMEVDNPSKP